MDKYTPTCPVLGVNVAVTGMGKTVEFLYNNVEELRGNYICVSNSHTVVMAHDDEGYMNIQNSAAMVLPDGKPLSVVQRNKGFHEAEKVSGPDLMAVMLNEDTKHYRHFFYGATEDTLEKLKQNLLRINPELVIAGMYAPPFRPLTASENADVINMINDSNPDFIWVGLGAPKQEKWMYEHSVISNDSSFVNGLMIGVGAAFDFHAGTVKRAPVWMQKVGFEWLYRLCQDPKRLFKRYLVTNTKFILYNFLKHQTG